MTTDYKKLNTLLQLIRTLRETPLPVSRLAQRYNTTTRTIYRYLEILRNCGFEVESDGDAYFLPNTEDDAFHAPLDQEEIGLLRDTLSSVHPTHHLTHDLLKKLNSLSGMEEIADLIVDKMVARNIKQLSQAIHDQVQVRLINYHSLNGKKDTDRLVEPVGFTTNLRYLYAYEPASEQVKQFKPERMEEVEILNQCFQLTDHHQQEKPDVFGMCGQPQCEVSLFLYPRAYHLLLEEYPEIRTTWHVKKTEKGYEAMIPAKGYEGIGRFVLGLPGEVEVLGPRGFVGYLEGKVEHFKVKSHESMIR